MKALLLILAFIYLGGSLFIFVFSLGQLLLTFSFLRSVLSRRRDHPSALVKSPSVTVQLPVYNEKHVILRLIESVSRMHYPPEKWEIQVLDDSDDETTQLIAEKVKEVKQRGIQIHHVRRGSREGFKAGALRKGLETATGEFIAIFDADFIPPPDFLEQTLPCFDDTRTGAVQTRWSHLNENQSVLTRTQAMALDAHFSVEQRGRNASGCFINFNGTAGVWRKACILDSGNWQDDTLTEDLDLSYRAQLRGWRFVYRDEILSPAEIPASIYAAKSQQFRWTKGAAETARKNLMPVWRSSLPLYTRMQAGSHLLNHLVFVCIFLNSLTAPAFLFIPAESLLPSAVVSLLPFTFLSTLFLFFFFAASLLNRPANHRGRELLLFVLRFPVFLTLLLGLSFHNAMASLEGWAGKKTSFIRTPKNGSNKQQTDTLYRSGRFGWKEMTEGGLAILFFIAAGFAFHMKAWNLLPFFLLLMAGYGAVFILSVRDEFAKV